MSQDTPAPEAQPADEPSGSPASATGQRVFDPNTRTVSVIGGPKAETEPAAEKPAAKVDAKPDKAAKVDAPPKSGDTTQPKEQAEGSPEDAEKGDTKPSRKDLPAEYEPVIESAVQAALKAERERQDKERTQREAADAQQREAEANRKAAEELRGLWQRAYENRDPEAQEVLLQKYLIDLGKQFQSGDTEKVLAERLEKLKPEIETATHEKARQALWTSYTEAFGLKADDAELLALPKDAGLKGLTAAALKKTADRDMIAAMLEHPGVKDAIDNAVKVAKEAARLDGLAKGLGSKDAPRHDPGTGSSGETYTDAEIDTAYMENPTSAKWAKLWRDKEARLSHSV